MSIEIEQAHLTDTLRYRVYASRRASQDEVRVAASVTALVPAANRDQAALEVRIRQALGQFIGCEWLLSRIQRSADTAGYERVTLSAIARVPAAENYDLENRARHASRNGLAITAPAVNYALSRSRVDAIVDELRGEVLDTAGAHAKAFSQRTGRTWRIGDIAFGAADVSGSTRTGKGAYRDASDSELGDLLASLEDEPLASMAGAERIWLVAAVTLKSRVDRS